MEEWLKFFDKKELSFVQNTLKSQLINGVRFTPEFNSIFKAFRLCNLQSLKVVMLGMDPYPQPNIATGIAFANKDTVKSPSLEVIKNALISLDNSDKSINFDPSLENWEKQGVLLINSALTVIVNNPGSHLGLWRPTIENFLYKLSRYYIGIIYVLFGTHAQSFSHFINSNANNIIFEKHPSYYARVKKPMSGEVFKEINKLLIEKNGEGIKWY